MRPWRRRGRRARSVPRTGGSPPPAGQDVLVGGERAGLLAAGGGALAALPDARVGGQGDVDVLLGRRGEFGGRGRSRASTEPNGRAAATRPPRRGRRSRCAGVPRTAGRRAPGVPRAALRSDRRGCGVVCWPRAVTGVVLAAGAVAGWGRRRGWCGARRHVLGGRGRRPADRRGVRPRARHRGARAADVRATLPPGVRAVEVPDWDRGPGAGVARALADPAVRAADAVLLQLVDLPHVDLAGRAVGAGTRLPRRPGPGRGG